MIYVVGKCQIPRDKVDEFICIMTEELAPLSLKYGMKLVACWKALSGTVGEVCDVWEFESFSDHEKRFAESLKDAELTAVRGKAMALVASEVISFYQPFFPKAKKSVSRRIKSAK